MKKYRILSIFLLIFVLFSGSIHLNSVTVNIPWHAVYAQYNSYLFFGGISWGKGVVADGNGYVYTTGSSLQWHTFLWGSPLFPFNMISSDAFVSKWDKKGNLIWYTFLGSDSWDYGEGIACDSEGNIYVAGTSSEGWNVGKYGTPVYPHSSTVSDNDGFVAKLSPQGELLWYTFLGGSNTDNLNAIDISNSGNIFVSGSSYNVWDTGTFGNPLIDYNPASFFTCDVVVAKLNNTGIIQWYTFLGSEDYEYATSISVAQGEAVFVSGGSFTYWPAGKYGEPVHDKMVDDQPDGFLAKLSSSGIFQWYTFIGEDKSVHPASIDSSKSGKIYMTGSISEGIVHFVLNEPARSSRIIGNKPNGVNLGTIKTFAASFEQNGEKNWARSYHFSEGSDGISIDVGPLGDLFISGTAHEWMSQLPDSTDEVDPVEIKAYSYLLNLNKGGNKKWIYRFEDYNFASGYSVDAISNGVTYITGNNFGLFSISSSADSPKIDIELPGIDSWVYLVKVNHMYDVKVSIKTSGGSAEKEVYEVIPGHDAVVDLIPEPGYEVDKIVDNGNEVEPADPYVISLVNRDHEVDVYFRLIRYPPELILSGTRVTDKAWIIEKEFGDLTLTIIEHETSPMDVKAYVLYKYINGEWKELTRFTEPGVYTYQDKFLIPDMEAKYILKAIAPDGSVIAESEILIL